MQSTPCGFFFFPASIDKPTQLFCWWLSRRNVAEQALTHPTTMGRVCGATPVPESRANPNKKLLPSISSNNWGRKLFRLLQGLQSLGLNISHKASSSPPDTGSPSNGHTPTAGTGSRAQMRSNISPGMTRVLWLPSFCKEATRTCCIEKPGHHQWCVVKSNLTGITSHNVEDAFSRSQTSTKGHSKSKQSRISEFSPLTSAGRTDGLLLPQLMPLIHAVHAMPFPPQTPWLSSFVTGRSLPTPQFIAFLNSCYMVLLHFPLFLLPVAITWNLTNSQFNCFQDLSFPTLTPQPHIQECKRESHEGLC